MNHYLKASFWRNALNDRMTWFALAVDAVPIFMVLFLGWRAEALVLLYWAENIVIGLATIVRLVWSGARMGAIGIGLCLFLVPFFMVHYGMFCFGHGVFVFSFAQTVDLNAANFSPSPAAIFNMFETIRTSFPGMTLALGLIALYQLTAAARDYWPASGKDYPDVMQEMFAPYGRIVTLHIAIILAGFIMMALGDPMIGVLLFILIRMGASIVGRAWRDRPKTDAPVESNQS